MPEFRARRLDVASYSDGADASSYLGGDQAGPEDREASPRDEGWDVGAEDVRFDHAERSPVEQRWDVGAEDVRFENGSFDAPPEIHRSAGSLTIDHSRDTGFVSVESTERPAKRRPPIGRHHRPDGPRRSNAFQSPARIAASGLAPANPASPVNSVSHVAHPDATSLGAGLDFDKGLHLARQHGL